MESQPQYPEFMTNADNFHSYDIMYILKENSRF